MFEQDYIMRLIHEIIRMLLKLIFHIDTESPIMEAALKEEQKTAFNELLDMIDAGYINEAENKLYAMLEDGNTESLETALLFYSYLNDKEDSFLTEHNFTRAEIKLGLEHVASKAGLSHVLDVFLDD